jgi:hypothetical protein
MTMRGGLTITTGAKRPRFVYAQAVNPAWLAEIRGLLTADEPPALTPGVWTTNPVGRSVFGSAGRTAGVVRAGLAADAPTG